MSDLKEKILEEYSKGNIVVSTTEGLQVINLEEFLKQPADGILYDINRNEATVLALMEGNPKWVNDFAAAKVIRALRERVSELERDLYYD